MRGLFPSVQRYLIQYIGIGDESVDKVWKAVGGLSTVLVNFSIIFFVMVTESAIAYLCWPGVKWLLESLFNRSFTDPSFRTIFLILLFVRMFVHDVFVKEAVNQAEKDRITYGLTRGE